VSLNININKYRTESREFLAFAALSSNLTEFLHLRKNCKNSQIEKKGFSCASNEPEAVRSFCHCCNSLNSKCSLGLSAITY
jgi:hypothetical protein